MTVAEMIRYHTLSDREIIYKNQDGAIIAKGTPRSPIPIEKLGQREVDHIIIQRTNAIITIVAVIRESEDEG